MATKKKSSKKTAAKRTTKTARAKAKSKRAPAKRTSAKGAAGPSIRMFLAVHEVGDLDAAAAGYAQLLGAPGHRIPFGGGRHYMALGEQILSLLHVERAPQPNGSDLYLSVTDLEGIHARAQALGWLSSADVHGAPAGEINRKPWGERSFYVADPWGNGLCFIEAGSEFTGRR